MNADAFLADVCRRLTGNRTILAAAPGDRLRYPVDHAVLLESPPRLRLVTDRPWTRHYEAGVPTALEFEATAVPAFLRRSAASHADAPAIVFMNRTLTYRELLEQVDRFSAALTALGVTRGTRVAIQLPNLPQTVIAYYATLSLGAQAVLTNPLYVEREIEHQWTDAGCTVAITTDFLFARRLTHIRARLPVEHYIITAIPDYLRFPLSWLAPLKLRRADPPLIARVEPADDVHVMTRLIRAHEPLAPDVELDLDETAVLQYTGGTTGLAKGAQLTHRNLSCNVQQIAAWFTQFERGAEVCMTSLPLFHSFGMTVCMNYPVYLASAMLLMPDPRDIRAITRAIAKHRVTLLPAVPAQFNAINQLPDAHRLDLSSVKVCVSGSAPLPLDVCEQFERLTGGRIAEGFGLSETSPVTHCNPLVGKRKIGSIGIPLPNTDAKIVSLDDRGVDVPSGTHGELVIRGPQVMRGYWQRPDETHAAIANGWFHTGDVAVMDEDGFFVIVGRKKDMIVASGYNIYPDEIDRVLMSHPDIVESATIGVPDETRGETVKAFVVRRQGADVSREALVEFCRRELAAYKVPRAIEFRESLPKSTVLKVLRRELRAEAIEKAAVRG
jgi:long-chain acyl-CoA synthetase